ncbi:hypothetical protein BD410DRAFT_790749 [Rickenella mellea]|uniref:Proteasome assembly chaperone 1 n=1 Tax=Rickenella mellea TaxID=50990 RepID=A0A4Y7PZV9_9AGAM|nr:hypothetical protein BD410DRAFT_790749 [Rickenella mellea]
MLRQDIDPLADTIPPRYAYESDDEDEFNPFPNQPSKLSQSSSAVPHNVNVKIQLGTAELSVGSLVFASGDAGKTWARGADLGEQVGAAFVENVQVGLIFHPQWSSSKALVIVSEVTTRLPTWAMHPYANAILGKFKPARVAILDTYATSTYITSQPQPHYEAPLRYLHIGSSSPSLNEISQFSPPNLSQGTTASLLSILALPSFSSSPSNSATAILLPTPHPSPLPPATIAPTDISKIGASDDVYGFEDSLMQKAHAALLKQAGIGGGKMWVGVGGDGKKDIPRSRRGDVGEGSMYI